MPPLPVGFAPCVRHAFNRLATSLGATFCPSMVREYAVDVPRSRYWRIEHFGVLRPGAIPDWVLMGW